jgi:KamA family protein
VDGLAEEEKEQLEQVTEMFKFRTNSYYLNLIHWNDPNDPIRNIVIPRVEELTDQGTLDPSQEHKVTVAKGCEHKYKSTALLLVSENCGGLCRFCFRKRLFLHDNREVNRDISEGLDYIRRHPEVNNVLLSGGDPMMLSTGRIDRILTFLRSIDHVRSIRIGTKMPAFNPFRILDDPGLLRVISKHSYDDRRIYIVTHFDHPRELTPEALSCVRKLIATGAILVNQTPLIRGINNDSNILTELFNRLSSIGAPQYYLFQCRPTRGNRCYSVPLDQGFRIYQEAITQVSGLAKRAKYVMSHATGKIEIVGFEDGNIYLKYHQAKDPKNLGRFFKLPWKPEAMWLDDLVECPDIY